MNFYTAIPMAGEWGFETPTGIVDGIRTEKRAELIAKAQEEQDRKEAASDSKSPIAAVLRKHFQADRMTAVTG